MKISKLVWNRLHKLIKPRSHCPGFQSRRRYRVDTDAHRDHTVATPIPGAEPWCIGTHQDTPQRLLSYTGNAPSQTVALPGQTVINCCPKPGLVRSTAGNIWMHSNSFPIRPGSPRSAGCKLPGRTGAYTGTVWTRLYSYFRLWTCLRNTYYSA